jgi:hypothetical protein
MGQRAVEHGLEHGVLVELTGIQVYEYGIGYRGITWRASVLSASAELH